jgi:hypothetical protein
MKFEDMPSVRHVVREPVLMVNQIVSVCGVDRSRQ